MTQWQPIETKQLTGKERDVLNRALLSSVIVKGYIARPPKERE